MSEGNFGTHACHHCQVNIEYPLELGGTTVTCPQCATSLVLPVSEQTVEEGPLTPESVLAAFKGGIKTKPTSFLYQLGLSLVAGTMLLLPIIYFALIAAATWATYYFATHFAWLLQSARGGPKLYILKVIAYVAPLFAGAVLVFFMIKPLFARRVVKAQPNELRSNEEPLLHATIHHICDLVGAPHPKRIEVACDVNASAGFRRGIWSMFGNDLVLTIGLPLAAGLTTAQLAGIIAHEFGHFNQGVAMRVSYVIRCINLWFIRMVYERDQWDAALQEWVDEAEDVKSQLFVMLAQGAVGLTRLILKPLMYLGHGISCFLMRQMEYDADNCEINMVGSKNFESTVYRLRIMGTAMEKGMKELQASWLTKQRLPDDLTGYIMLKEEELPAKEREKIVNFTGLSKTGHFDSHPSDGDRIRQARLASDNGVFDCQRPATELFADFPGLAKRITTAHYIVDLGLPLEKSMLHPVSVFRQQE